MDFVQTMYVWMLSLMAAGFGIAFLVALLRRDNSRAAYRFAVQVGLPLVRNDIAARVSQRVRRRQVASFGGALIGILLSIGLVSVVSPSATPLGWVIPLTVVLAALIVAQTIETLRWQLSIPRPQGRRVARLRVLSVADFVSPFRRVLPDVLLVVVGILGIAALIVAVPVNSMAAVVAGVSVVIAVGVGVGIRFLTGVIVHQPQPASDTWDLAWDDAFRADAVRAIFMTQVMVSWAAVCVVGSVLVGAWSPESSMVTSSGFFFVQNSFTLGLVTASCVYGYGTALRYYRDRLWPGILDSWEAPVPVESPA